MRNRYENHYMSLVYFLIFSTALFSASATLVDDEESNVTALIAVVNIILKYTRRYF